jgi:hypothetical protein
MCTTQIQVDESNITYFVKRKAVILRPKKIKSENEKKVI